MEVYVKKDGELIPVNSGIDLFESMNTHSGDCQTTEIVVTKTDEESVKNLMLELSIVDKDIEVPLSRDASDSNEVVYFRGMTEKNIKFTIEAVEGEESSFIKPDRMGLFLIEKNFSEKSEINLLMTCTVDEGFSEKFGEISTLGFRMSWYGEVNEKKSFI